MDRSTSYFPCGLVFYQREANATGSWICNTSDARNRRPSEDSDSHLEEAREAIREAVQKSSGTGLSVAWEAKPGVQSPAELWLQEPPYESVFLTAIVQKDLACQMKRQVRALADQCRSRFFGMRKYVQDLQFDKAALFRCKYPIHPRAMDLALIFSEDYLLQYVIKNTYASRASSGSTASHNVIPGGGRSEFAVKGQRSVSFAQIASNSDFVPALRRHELKQLANCALWVAAKIEEVSPPMIETFAETEYEEFLSFEMKMSKAIGWRYNPITCSDFLNFFMASEGYGSTSLERHLTNQILRSELRFQYDTMVTVVAAIVLCGAYSGRERKIIDANVITVSRVDRDVLVNCVDASHDLLHNMVEKGEPRVSRHNKFLKLAEWIRQWKPSKPASPEMPRGVSLIVKSSPCRHQSVRDERFEVWLRRSKALQAATGSVGGLSSYVE